jgi:protein SMG6
VPVEGSREWNVEGKLAKKVTQWKEEDHAEREEEVRVEGGQKMVRRMMIFRERVRMTRMVRKRSKLSKVSNFFVGELDNSFVFVSGSSKSAKSENTAISSSPPHRRLRAPASNKTICSRVPLSIIPGCRHSPRRRYQHPPLILIDDLLPH